MFNKDKQNQQIVYTKLATFIYYFVNYRLSFEQSREFILHFSKQYDLEKSRTHILLGDLEALQKNQTYKLTKQDQVKISEKRKDKQTIKFGDHIILGLVVCWID